MKTFVFAIVGRNRTFPDQIWVDSLMASGSSKLIAQKRAEKEFTQKYPGCEIKGRASMDITDFISEDYRE